MRLATANAFTCFAAPTFDFVKRMPMLEHWFRSFRMDVAGVYWFDCLRHGEVRG